MIAEGGVTEDLVIFNDAPSHWLHDDGREEGNGGH